MRLSKRAGRTRSPRACAIPYIGAPRPQLERRSTESEDCEPPARPATSYQPPSGIRHDRWLRRLEPRKIRSSTRYAPARRRGSSGATSGAKARSTSMAAAPPRAWAASRWPSASHSALAHARRPRSGQRTATPATRDGCARRRYQPQPAPAVARGRGLPSRRHRAPWRVGPRWRCRRWPASRARRPPSAVERRPRRARRLRSRSGVRDRAQRSRWVARHGSAEFNNPCTN